MKNTFLKLTLQIAFALSVFFSCKAKNDGKLVLASLGNISENDTIANVTFANIGGSRIKFEDYTSSCECFMLTDVGKYSIEPGDSTVVQFKLAPKKGEKKIPITITIKNSGSPRFLSFSFLR